MTEKSGQGSVSLRSLQWPHLARERSDQTNNNNMLPLLLFAAISLLCPVQGLDLGYGGLPGERTPLTGKILLILPSLSSLWLSGSVWPPYPGAGQGYWAARAGFYKTGPGQRNKKINNNRQSDTQTVEPGNSFVYNNGNTRYIP